MTEPSVVDAYVDVTIKTVREARERKSYKFTQNRSKIVIKKVKNEVSFCYSDRERFI